MRLPRPLRDFEAVVSLVRHLRDAISPFGAWAGAIMTSIAGTFGVILGAPAWVHTAFVLGLFLSVLAIWDFRMRRKETKVSASGKPGWEIAGARKKNFTLKEAAALIAGVDMALPLTGLARDEHEALCQDAENGTLPVLIPKGKEFAPVYGGRPIVQELALKVQKKFHKDIFQKVKVERESLRDYIRSQDRPVPKFLSERFDQAVTLKPPTADR